MVSTAVFNFRSKFDNFIYCGYYRSLVTDIVRLTVVLYQLSYQDMTKMTLEISIKKQVHAAG